MKLDDIDSAHQSIVPTASLSILTIAQVARELRLSRAKVYQMVKYDGLPAMKFGSALRVRRVALNKWLELRETIA